MPRLARDLLQLLIGLPIFGAGLALTVRGDFGLGPWTVFHEGLSNHTPLSIGVATILTGVAVTAIMLALRVRIGIGTIFNVILVGLSTDVTLWLIDPPSTSGPRIALTLVGPFLVALGSSLYLGVHRGPGPRDGVMTGLAARGLSVRVARFVIEACAFSAGLLLGGTIGWGTVWWLLTIGPAVQWMLPWFDHGPVESG